jgi:hypothetical protein
MTNEELNKLTTAARDAAALIPRLLTDGDGNLMLMNGEQCSVLHLLRDLSVVRSTLQDVANALANIPRRPTKAKPLPAAKPKAKRKAEPKVEERDTATRDWAANPPKDMKEWMSAPPGTPQPSLAMAGEA